MSFSDLTTSKKTMPYGKTKRTVGPEAVGLHPLGWGEWAPLEVTWPSKLLSDRGTRCSVYHPIYVFIIAINANGRFSLRFCYFKIMVVLELNKKVQLRYYNNVRIMKAKKRIIFAL